jgi:osmotically inducible protein OsmC
VSPEELIAAAHATCVSMALSHVLAEDGHAPTRLDSERDRDLRQDRRRLPDDEDRAPDRGRGRRHRRGAFREAAEGAKDNCPVSKALEGNVEISVDATLAEGYFSVLR